MKRRRPQLFLKGRTARARRSLAVVFALLFAPAAPRGARADCVPFAAPPVITTDADEARSVFVADLDADGDLDVLSAALVAGTVNWYENDGQGGGWTARTISTQGAGPIAVSAGDLDGDGDPDVLSGWSGSRLLWHRNDGTPHDGGWGFGTISTVAAGPGSIAAADVDGDGDLDVLAAASTSDKVAWHENDGAAGGWAEHAIVTALDGASSVVSADVDGDGDLDALVAGGTPPVALWYENDGTPAGAGWAVHSISAGAEQPFALAAADLDDDGDLDAVAASFADDALLWYENDGTPASGAWQLHVITTLAPTAVSVAVADLDGDGDLDVFGVSSDDDKLAWLENDGDGGVWTVHTISTAIDSPRSVVAADLDRDGDADALTASRLDDTVAWFRNERPRGEPAFRGAVTLNGVADAFRQLAVADVDGNGTSDFVAASQLDDRITLILNSPIITYLTVATTANGALSVATGDVDGDGDSDLLAASRDDDTVAWYENDGTPGDPFWVERAITTLADGARQVVVGDVDGDGDLDAASASSDDDLIAWYENDGTPLDGGWLLRTISAPVDGALSVALADVDGDGDLDAVSVSFLGDEVSWHESDGTPADGGWTDRLISGELVDPRFVITGDFDRDGDVDVVSASVGDDTVALHRNVDGVGGSWSTLTVSSTASYAYSIAAIDVDGDGDLDLAAALYGDDEVVWYENDGSGGGWSRRLVATVAGPTAVAFGDLRGSVGEDGELESVIVTNLDTLRFGFNPGTLIHAEGQETNEGTSCWSDQVP